MNDLMQITGWGLLLAPVAGSIASGSGRAWGNLLTAATCGIWAALVLFASGGFRGSLLAITAISLVVVAVVELLLAVELRDRQRAARPDGAIRAASAILALVVPAIVVVFAMLLFSAWIAAIS